MISSKSCVLNMVFSQAAVKVLYGVLMLCFCKSGFFLPSRLRSQSSSSDSLVLFSSVHFVLDVSAIPRNASFHLSRQT